MAITEDMIFHGKPGVDAAVVLRDSTGANWRLVVNGDGGTMKVTKNGTTQTTISSTFSSPADDVTATLGSDADVALVLNSAGLAANTALTGVLVGTPVTPAIAANSGIIANITASGDLLLAANRGGNSEGYLFADSSAGQLYLYGPNGNIILTPSTDVSVANGTGLIVGGATQVTVNTILPELQVLGTAAADAAVVIGAFSTTDSVQPTLNFLKSGNATIGSSTIVATGENLGAIVWHADDGTDYVSVAASIGAVAEATQGANDSPASIVINTSPDGTQAVTEKVRVNSKGNVFIGDGTVTAHANALGPSLIIDQKGNDDLAFALKSSDVSTGLTTGTVISDVAVDDYLAISKFAAATGGALVQVVGENAAVTTNLKIESYGGQAHSTHTTAGRALIELFASQHDGSNALAALGDATNAVGIRVYTGGAETTRFMFDENGEVWNDGTVTAFDEHDDLSLVRAMSLGAKGYVESKWDSFVSANESNLIDLGILGGPRAGIVDGERGLVCFTKLQRLHNGAIWQMYEDIMEIAAVLPEDSKALLPERIQSRLAAVSVPALAAA